MTAAPDSQSTGGLEIAIVGMACRFPGAENVEQYWGNLRQGVESIRFFSQAELKKVRADLDLLNNPKFVKATCQVENIELFDASFFGINAREAEMTDPQHRVFLECAWEALESSGYEPESYEGAIGVYAGSALNAYLQNFPLGGFLSHPVVGFQAAIGNDKDHLSTRVSYKLNLKGPSVNVQTACSTSLVAVHLACQGLISGECDMALAGGISLIFPRTSGYLYQEGMMQSPDGHCRVFDAKARGTIFGDGWGIVVLKRLADALADGDTVYAVIRGSAINNDGAQKVGYTAPSVEAQVKVIQIAQAIAEIEPETITYIEAHGTGTELGDPVEIAALTKAFRAGTQSKSFCAIGSVKANIGHANTAAGVAGLIKVALALKHKEVPASLNFEEPNPAIDFANSPFYVNTKLATWSPGPTPRRAGISSFGIGGTNAHLVLEEAPTENSLGSSRSWQLLLLSARTDMALDTATINIARHLRATADLNLADVAYTLQLGRKTFVHRRMLVCRDTEDAARMLQSRDAQRVFSTVQERHDRPIAFMFTGQGSQYVGMGAELYANEPTFRQNVDVCAELLKADLELDLRNVLYPNAVRTKDLKTTDNGQLDETWLTQPALFVIEYALAKLWAEWGVKPRAMIGHSIGEYVAACLAGVFSLEDALALVAARGRLMQSLPRGAMLSVALVENQLRPLLGDEISLAAVNGPELCVVAGPIDTVDALEHRLRNGGSACQRLPTSHAFHSAMMEPILERFIRLVEKVSLRAPIIPYISNVTGTWITPAEATDPNYWARHLRRTVRFGEGVQELMKDPSIALLEIGPDQTLTTLARRNLGSAGDRVLLSSLRRWQDEQSDVAVILGALGRLWLAGVPIDWKGFYTHERRRRIPLPTYPFQRERFWVDYPGDRTTIYQSPTLRGSATGNALLGTRLRSPALSAVVFETLVSTSRPPFLAHHRVYGSVILPSSAYLEMVFSAAIEVYGKRRFGICNFTVHEALVLSEVTPQRVQILFSPVGEKQAAFQIVADEEEENWKRHATGTLQWTDEDKLAPDMPSLDVAAVRERCREEINSSAYYGKLYKMGLDFGEDFRGLNQIWRRDGEALGYVVLPESIANEAQNYQIHPAFLDACFHLIGAPLTNNLDAPYLLVGIEQLNIRREVGTRLWSHTVLRQREGGVITGDVRLYSENADLVVEALGLHLTVPHQEDFHRGEPPAVGDWLYRVAWQPKPQPRLVAQTVIDPAVLTAGLRSHARKLIAEHQLHIYKNLLSDLNALSLNYIIQALQKIGWQYQPGERLSIDEVIDQLGIAHQHQRLFRRLLAILEENGVLQQEGRQWEVVRPLESIVSSLTASSLLKEYPNHDAEIQLLDQCGPHLASVIRGTQDPLHLLFADGSLAAATRVYEKTPFFLVYNNLVAEVVKAASADLRQENTFRILEIGAGTGASTASILPILPAAQVEYVFTDLSPLFLKRAQEKFAVFPFVEYRLLNIEDDPRAQGFPNHGFDLIIAANVLHATANLRKTLAHVKQLLAPDGLLVVLEASGQQKWVDITFGLTEGWWKFTDYDLRDSSPLLSRPEWRKLMLSEGLTAVSTIPDAPDHGDLLNLQTIYIARGQETMEATQIPKGWVIFSDETGVGQTLAERLRYASQEAIVVRRGDVFRQESKTQYHVNPGNPDDYVRLTKILFAEERPVCQGFVHLWSLDSPSPEFLSNDCHEIAQSRGVLSLLLLAQALIRSGTNNKSQKPRLWLATHGAQPAESVPNPAQAPICGLARVLALEHPELWGAMIDLDAAASPAQNADHLWRELRQQPNGEDQVAWRGEKRLVPRLIRDNLPEAARVKIAPEGAYLVTGGLGGLGVEIARWLATQGASHIVLTSRSGIPSRAKWHGIPQSSEAGRRVRAVKDIESLGATVHIAVVDVANTAQMADLFAQFGRTMPPLRGVIHTAVAMTAWPIATMPSQALIEMLRPKIHGTWLLHELTRDMGLDFFVLFSSTTTLWGARELGHYAAANQFMDALAHFRHAHGLPAITVNWGTWEVMRVASTVDQELTHQFGLRRMPPSQALSILHHLLGQVHLAQVVVADIEWRTLKSAYEAKRPKPFLSKVHDRHSAMPTPAGASRLMEQVAGRNATERRRIVVAEVKNAVARVFGITVPRLTNTQQGLFDMGMDSLMSVELKSYLEAAVGQTLPSTLTFNYPTIDDLAEYLDTKIIAQSPAQDKGRSETSNSETETVKAVDTDNLGEDDLAALLLEKLKELN